MQFSFTHNKPLTAYKNDFLENEEAEFERIATAARPGTSIKTAFLPRPASRNLMSSNRPRTLTGRPKTGLVIIGIKYF